ncbi:HAD-IIIC family phosphatase [Gluconobacter wancherniae]|uniref:HAD-IIIC family phosphatase n=1 Tax=Gluconobacter wancherniae TaxID=1307955 RepID=UPI001B8DA6A9|nr:HAD-IIIC family phosphatase [Gluconobacter wancherniae]MBS1095855.1 HAD-IIIC family phosphatase [Gluconobacter wancherniae]
MRNIYPKSPSEEIGSPLDPSRLLLLGMCPIATLTKEFPEQFQVDHMLWESRPQTHIPDIEFGNYKATIISLTLRHILTESDSPCEDYFSTDVLWPRLIGTEKITQYFEFCAETLINRLSSLREISTKTPLFFLSFIEPRENFVGLLMPRFNLNNPAYFVQRLNQVMEETISTWGNSWFIDVNEVLNSIGRMRVQDDYVNHLSHASYMYDPFVEHERDLNRIQTSTPPSKLYDSPKAVSETAQGVVDRILMALKIIERKDEIKLIIIDLDDTLWRGIAADEAIEVWGNPEGWPMGFIEALLVFKARGGILAIVSKNEEEATLSRLRVIHSKRLEISDFASYRINFRPKSENIAEILSDINVLPSNTLFIDDNPREINEVVSVFPEIRVLSREHFDWRRKILCSPETQTAQLNGEASNRTENVRAAIHRKHAKKTLTREEWLASLELKQSHILISNVEHPNFQRGLELINKTNQFNTTGRRWTQIELQNFFSDGGVMICATLKDRMTNNGLIGAMLVRNQDILQAVLSCRVFGLTVEQAMLNYTTRFILQNNTQVRAYIENTGKNFTCHNFYKSFSFVEDVTGVFTCQHIVPYPDYIIEDKNEFE